MKKYRLLIGVALGVMMMIAMGAATNYSERTLFNFIFDGTDAIRVDLSTETLTESSANTNTVATIQTLTHETSGTAAAGIGVGLDFVQDTAASGATNDETAMRIEAVATDVTSTSEDFDYVLKLMDAGATVAERWRMDSDGLMTLVNSGTISNVSNGTVAIDEPSSATTTAVNILTVAHSTSGTAGTGMGTGIAFQAEDAGGAQAVGMSLQMIATDSTAGSEDYDAVLNVMDAGSAAAEVLRVTSDGVLTLENAATIDNTTNGTVVITEPTISLQGAVDLKTCTIADGDATPDVTGCAVLTTSSNTGATEITDLDNPVVGAIYVIIGGSATNSSTITDGGNFALSAGYTASVDETITLFVQADNDYIELTRSTN